MESKGGDEAWRVVSWAAEVLVLLSGRGCLDSGDWGLKGWQTREIRGNRKGAGFNTFAASTISLSFYRAERTALGVLHGERERQSQTAGQEHKDVPIKSSSLPWFAHSPFVPTSSLGM